MELASSYGCSYSTNTLDTLVYSFTMISIQWENNGEEIYLNATMNLTCWLVVKVAQAFLLYNPYCLYPSYPV